MKDFCCGWRGKVREHKSHIFVLLQMCLFIFLLKKNCFFFFLCFWISNCTVLYGKGILQQWLEGKGQRTPDFFLSCYIFVFCVLNFVWLYFCIFTAVSSIDEDWISVTQERRRGHQSFALMYCCPNGFLSFNFCNFLILHCSVLCGWGSGLQWLGVGGQRTRPPTASSPFFLLQRNYFANAMWFWFL